MSFMFEVYYRGPMDRSREQRLTATVAQFDGSLECRDETDITGDISICLTYEFENATAAQQAAIRLQQLGEYIEGPVEYGP